MTRGDLPVACSPDASSMGSSPAGRRCRLVFVSTNPCTAPLHQGDLPMTWMPGTDPIAGDPASCDLIDAIIVPRARDIGGFEVRRALPSAKRQMIGPFIFFDQMGPAELLVGGGLDVRPHPHIGLATVTYLFDGEIHHRDSLGTDQVIRPGDLNWMTAGKGIVHSEREDPERKARTRSIFGIQSWVALPKHLEETAPDFEHHGVDALPVL